MNFLKKNIFLIDGIGALLSSMMLGLVLPQFNLGLPNLVFTVLAAFAFVYGVYSVSCFYLREPANSIWLKIIAIANIVYCLATLIVLAIFYAQLATIGIAYFLAEIAIILGLVRFELELVSSNRRKK